MQDKKEKHLKLLLPESLSLLMRGLFGKPNSRLSIQWLFSKMYKTTHLYSLSKVLTFWWSTQSNLALKAITLSYCKPYPIRIFCSSQITSKTLIRSLPPSVTSHPLQPPTLITNPSLWSTMSPTLTLFPHLPLKYYPQKPTLLPKRNPRSYHR